MPPARFAPLNEPFGASSIGLVRFGSLIASGADVIVVLVVGDVAVITVAANVVDIVVRLASGVPDAVVAVSVAVVVAVAEVAVVDATIKGAAVAKGAGVVVLAAVMLSQVCVAPVSAG